MLNPAHSFAIRTVITLGNTHTHTYIQTERAVAPVFQLPATFNELGGKKWRYRPASTDKKRRMASTVPDSGAFSP